MSLKATAEALRVIALFICVYSFETLFVFVINLDILDILCYKLRIVAARWRSSYHSAAPQKEAPSGAPCVDALGLPQGTPALCHSQRTCLLDKWVTLNLP